MDMINKTGRALACLAYEAPDHILHTRVRECLRWYWVFQAISLEEQARWGGTHLYTQHSRPQRQEDLCGFKASQVYTASSRMARVTQQDIVTKTTKEKGKAKTPH